MDLKQAIATLICPRYPLAIEGLDFGDGGDRPLPGGYCCFGIDLPNSLIELAKLRREGDGVFPYVCSDLERGAGQMIPSLTRLPPATALGAANDPELAYEAGRLTAIEARNATISLIFAPVVDVATEPRNPIVATRAFGADAERVGTLAGAFARGVLEGGALPTAKHYPGHGSTYVDSHLELPRIEDRLDRLAAIDELPFRALIRDQVSAVMLGHLDVPAITGDHEPTTLSAAAVRRLRSELRFDGLIVTDALDMRAIPEGTRDEEQPAVRAVAAGVDIPLLPRDPHRAARGLLAAARSGLIPPQRLIEIAERIRTTVRKVSIPAEPSLDPQPGGDELALRIARAGVVQLGGEHPPIQGDLEVAVIDDGGGEVGTPLFFDALKRVGITPRAVTTPSHRNAKLLIAIFSEVRHMKGRVTLDDERSALVKRLSQSASDVTVVSIGCPQSITGMELSLPTWFVFDRDPASLTAAAESLAGDPARGTPCWTRSV